MAERLPRVFGDYALLERLGQGAAGDVYLARPLDGNRGLPAPIVIKRMHERHAKDEEFVRRFRHEAQVAVCVDSPHVAKVYAVGASGGTLYIAMEYVSGMPVSRFLTGLVNAKRYIPTAIVAELLAGGLTGLDSIHTAKDLSGRPLGFVHRDISPKNLMVGDDGVLRLIDLGFGKSNVQDWKTGTGIVLGSIGYMSPEQIQARPLDHRTDIYAMGIVLFELLTLRRYIKPDALPAMVAASLSQPFVAPSEYRPDIPRGFDELARRAISADPSDRFQTATEFLEALRKVSPAPCPRGQIVSFLQTILDVDVNARKREIARLLAQPLPELEGEEEATRVDIYAQRTVANEISAKTEAGMGLPPSVRALLNVPVAAATTDTTEVGSGPSRARLRELARGRRGPQMEEPTHVSLTPTEAMRDTEIKSVHDRTRLLAPRPAVVTVSQSGQPMAELAPIWVEQEQSLFVGPRLWVVGALVVIAMGAGVVGGMLIASSREQRVAAQLQGEPAAGNPSAPSSTNSRSGNSSTENPSAAAVREPPSIERAEPAAERAAEPSAVEHGESGEEAAADRDDGAAARAAAAKSARRTPAKPKVPAKDHGSGGVAEAGGGAGEGGDSDAAKAISTKAKALEERAARIKRALPAEDPRALSLQKLLLDLSLVRASRNSERAEEQLRGIERGLDELERR